MVAAHNLADRIKSILREALSCNTVEFANAVWQVTSGGAGAPFYDKELDLPWSGELRAHSTQPHYAFFRINGDDVLLEAYSKTGQKIDEAVLRKDGRNVAWVLGSSIRSESGQ